MHKLPLVRACGQQNSHSALNWGCQQTQIVLCNGCKTGARFTKYLNSYYKIIRDVNETRESRVCIFFLDPEKGISRLTRIETSDHPTIVPIVSGIIVTGRSALATSLSHLYAACGCGPHTRCTDAAKQRTVAYLCSRGSGDRCFCHRVLISLL